MHSPVVLGSDGLLAEPVRARASRFPALGGGGGGPLEMEFDGVEDVEGGGRVSDETLRAEVRSLRRQLREARARLADAKGAARGADPDTPASQQASVTVAYGQLDARARVAVEAALARAVTPCGARRLVARAAAAQPAPPEPNEELEEGEIRDDADGAGDNTDGKSLGQQESRGEDKSAAGSGPITFYESFCIDRVGCGGNQGEAIPRSAAAAGYRVPAYIAVNPIPIPVPSGPGGPARALRLCFNCGGSHMVRNCPMARDEAAVRDNLRLMRSLSSRLDPGSSGPTERFNTRYFEVNRAGTGGTRTDAAGAGAPSATNRTRAGAGAAPRVALAPASSPPGRKRHRSHVDDGRGVTRSPPRRRRRSSRERHGDSREQRHEPVEPRPRSDRGREWQHPGQWQGGPRRDRHVLPFPINAYNEVQQSPYLSVRPSTTISPEGGYTGHHAAVPPLPPRNSAYPEQTGHATGYATSVLAPVGPIAQMPQRIDHALLNRSRGPPDAPGNGYVYL